MLKDFLSFANIFFIFCKDNNFPGGSEVKHLPAMWETRVWPLGWEDSLEKEMATHSSTVAWKIPWMEEWGHKESDTTQWLLSHSLFANIGSSDWYHLTCHLKFNYNNYIHCVRPKNYCYFFACSFFHLYIHPYTKLCIQFFNKEPSRKGTLKVTVKSLKFNLRSLSSRHF